MTCHSAIDQASIPKKAMDDKPRIAVNHKQAVYIICEADYPIEIRKFKPKRTGRQNNTTHLWYHEMAVQDEQYDELGWKSYCKLTYGVPILLVDPDFAEFYEAALKPFDYETQMKRIRFIDITSIMDKQQGKLYMDMLYRNETRFRLTDPDPKKRRK